MASTPPMEPLARLEDLADDGVAWRESIQAHLAYYGLDYCLNKQEYRRHVDSLAFTPNLGDEAWNDSKMAHAMIEFSLAPKLQASLAATLERNHNLPWALFAEINRLITEETEARESQAEAARHLRRIQHLFDMRVYCDETYLDFLRRFCEAYNDLVDDGCNFPEPIALCTAIRCLEASNGLEHHILARDLREQQAMGELDWNLFEHLVFHPEDEQYSDFFPPLFEDEKEYWGVNPFPQPIESQAIGESWDAEGPVDVETEAAGWDLDPRDSDQPEPQDEAPDSDAQWRDAYNAYTESCLENTANDDGWADPWNPSPAHRPASHAATADPSVTGEWGHAATAAEAWDLVSEPEEEDDSYPPVTRPGSSSSSPGPSKTNDDVCAWPPSPPHPATATMYPDHSDRPVRDVAYYRRVKATTFCAPLTAPGTFEVEVAWQPDRYVTMNGRRRDPEEPTVAHEDAGVDADDVDEDYGSEAWYHRQAAAATSQFAQQQQEEDEALEDPLAFERFPESW
ncbi:hypothetical protein F4780DRAFT_736412 [Xylariomycetidae sp. FL0641]|nr:hypothetical protein F4780DRAFT_736412 [Xylariomycetidae sp. FL0641]